MKYEYKYLSTFCVKIWATVFVLPLDRALVRYVVILSSVSNACIVDKRYVVRGRRWYR